MTDLTAEDWAAIEKNAESWAAEEIPDHVMLRIARIWNSASNNAPKGEERTA